MTSLFSIPRFALWFFASALLFAAPAAFALEAGQLAPDFKLKGNAEIITLSGLRGQFVYVDFWASWCAPCRLSFPWMSVLQNKFRDKGLVVVAINLDESNEPTREFLGKFPPGFKVAYDPQAVTPKAYEVLGMPTSFLIGKDGKVIFRHSGFKNADRAELEARIATAMAAP